MADTSLHSIPDDADEEAMVMLSDILPTGYECGVLNGCVKPGDTVAIIGAGPIGLAALLTAQFYAPANIIMIDRDDNRLDVSNKLGATRLINSADGKAVEKSHGHDHAARAWMWPSKRSACRTPSTSARPSSLLADTSPTSACMARACPLHLEKLWSQNITITTRLVDAVTTPLLLKTVMSGKLQPKQLITHRFHSNEVMSAYDTFGNAARERALKVILTNEQQPGGGPC